MTLRRLSLLVLTASCAAGSAQTGVDAAGKAFREGVAATQAHQLTLAEQKFRAVVRLAPGIAAGHSALGAVLVQEGRSGDALPELRRALQMDPNDGAAQLNLGTASAAVLGTSAGTSAQVEEGITALQAWRTQHGTALPPDSSIALAQLYMAKQQPADAAQTLEAALAAAPSDPTLQDAEGILLAQQKHFAEAEPHFRAALAAAPAGSDTLAAILLHLGADLVDEGRATDALSLLQQAASLRPNNTAIQIQLGSAQFQAGDEAGALATLRHALEQDPRNSQAAYQLALTLESLGRNQEAVPLFAQALTARPDDPDILTNYGLALVQTGKAREALPLYTRAVKLAPNDATLHQDLGVAYLQQSDLDNAIAEFARSSALDPNSAQIAYDLGLAYKLKDHFAESIAAFEKARSLDPQLADAPYSLGVLYMQQGDFSKAASALQQAVALRPDNGEMWGMLGSVLKQDGKPKEAAEALRRAVALDPGQPGNHVNLASVLIELGDREGAAAERKQAAELSRAATAKQKERFALDSGNVLLQRGQFAEASTQFRNAIAADPTDAAPHLALADALDHLGAKAEADVERARGKALQSKQ
ncbi:tetratricopeptide repeat protein [Terriglobus aquaticus]|uniref:Tetratricopeptide repeat protein n=1 Tax=Terriglobus aquaticus TaxID=940139 RepID=A0ABW9KMT9_9BACT|nr:tetratricopeptide repeat protein [Terriglobus aquaticus]